MIIMLPQTPTAFPSPASPSRQSSATRPSKTRPRHRPHHRPSGLSVNTHVRRADRILTPKRKKTLQDSTRRPTVRQTDSPDRPASNSQDETFLPLFLPRPDRPANINIGAIKGLDPEVPLEYLLKKLSERGPELLGTALSCSLSNRRIVQSPLPSIMTFVVPPNVSSDVLPTHMLAIRSTATSSSSPEQPTGALLPVHAVVYQASCAHVPHFPSFEHLPVDQIPVVYIALPSPNQLPLVNNFLYTQRSDELLEKLLNIPYPARPSSRAGLMKDMASRLDKTALMARIAVIRGTWENVCALGIADPALWRTMDIAWKILVGSLALLESKQKQSSSSSS